MEPNALTTHVKAFFIAFELLLSPCAPCEPCGSKTFLHSASLCEPCGSKTFLHSASFNGGATLPQLDAQPAELTTSADQ